MKAEVRTGTVLFCRERKKAWAAQTPLGRVWLPADAGGVWEGTQLRPCANGEPRPRPIIYDRVVFIGPGDNEGELVALQWAIEARNTDW